MPEAFFKWIDSTDKTLPRDLERRQETTLRIAQITDLHLPGEVELATRLRDLVSSRESIGELTRELSAISNEFGHQFRSARQHYHNLIKKTLVGLHRLGVDHLVITGDLVHCGVAAEFLDIRGALELTDWWGEDKLTVVPGNHDRFVLYEDVKEERMESFFDVVSPREPRFKLLPSGVALLEIDSNRPPGDRHRLTEYLPNTVGKIYPEVVEYVRDNQQMVQGRRLITLLHHHVTDDWYPPRASTVGGMMEAAEGIEELTEAIEDIDPYSIILHGHKHDVMDVDYTYGTHQVGCPGGFAESQRFNLIDFNRRGEETLTQVQLRT